MRYRPQRSRRFTWISFFLLFFAWFALTGAAAPQASLPASSTPAARHVLLASKTTPAIGETPATGASTAAEASTGAKPAALVRRRHHHRRKAGTEDSIKATLAANAAARDGPRRGAYLNSALIYDYEPARIYTIHTSPRFLTTITLRPGEKLISKAAGDTVRWVIGETVEGSGETSRVVVLIKPVRADLRTNVVLTTDQRTYLIDAVSTDGDAYTSLLAWNYPADQARELSEARSRFEAREAVKSSSLAVSHVEDGVGIDRLNFRYRIEPIHSRSPHWQPIRAFDDGAKTYVEFPADLGTSEAPPLFLVGEKGEAELVNYRLKGSYYVVDRLFDVAELRLGDKTQTIVRISRLGAPRAEIQGQ